MAALPVKKGYVISSKEGQLYVGVSNDIEARVLQHIEGKGAEWTKDWKQVELVDIFDLVDGHTENNKTLDYMAKYGINNIRGGNYTSVVLSASDRYQITKHIRGAGNLCYKCGEKGHFAKECKFVAEYKHHPPPVGKDGGGEPAKKVEKPRSPPIINTKLMEVAAFGKYKGQRIPAIAASDPQYCDWVIRQKRWDTPQGYEFARAIKVCSQNLRYVHGQVQSQDNCVIL